jgi:hypothetical protein
MKGDLDYIPSRMALAGGWIDQPFISRLNPDPPGSMVVVRLKPTVQFMDRAGMASGTRRAAQRLWNGRLPNGDRAQLVKQLYAAENTGRSDPSGSQDMIGLIYPGISRLDYDAAHDDGIFPIHIESNTDPSVARWLQRVIHLLPIAPRPPEYNPLQEQHLNPASVAELGRTGKTCFDAIIHKDLHRLAQSMNRCMQCWESLLPCTVRHSTIKIDLPGILKQYQSRYPGAMYSGCGGGYLYVASEVPVPGSFSIEILDE